MADNLDITAGTGTTIKTDDIGGVHYQQIKLVDGTLDSATIIAVDVGVKANALRVAPANNITDATYIGDIKFGEALPANTNTQEIVGDVAENAVAAGNPVLVGGRYDNTPRTLGDTDVGAIALDADGAVHIADGGNTITIDGTVTANLSSTDNTVLDNIQTAVELIDNAIDGNYLNVNANIAGTDFLGGAGGVAAGVQRITLASDDPAVAHLANIVGDTNNIETAIQIIDDWDATHDSAVSADGPQLMAAYDSTKPTAVDTDADAVRVLADAYGRLLAGVEPERFQATITSANATSATMVKLKTAAKKMYILTLIVSTDTAMNIQFQDDTGPTVLIEQLYLAANGGAVINFPPEAPLVVNTNEDFDVIASVAGNISVTITGYLAP